MGIDIADTAEMDISALDPAAMDGTISGYRADAASAKFSRELAAGMYGDHRYDRQFRIYYLDHTDHGSEVGSALEGQIIDPGRLPTHIVRYRPALEQLLRDLSAWVEEGVGF